MAKGIKKRKPRNSLDKAYQEYLKRAKAEGFSHEQLLEKSNFHTWRGELRVRGAEWDTASIVERQMFNQKSRKQVNAAFIAAQNLDMDITQNDLKNKETWKEIDDKVSQKYHELLAQGMTVQSAAN